MLWSGPAAFATLALALCLAGAPPVLIAASAVAAALFACLAASTERRLTGNPVVRRLLLFWGAVALPFLLSATGFMHH